MKAKIKSSIKNSIRFTNSKLRRDTKTMQVWVSCSKESMPIKIKYWMSMNNKLLRMRNLKKKVNQFLNLTNSIRLWRFKKIFLSISTSTKKKITASQKITTILFREMNQLLSRVMLQYQILCITGFITAAQCGCQDLMLLPELLLEWINLISRDFLLGVSFVERKAAMLVLASNAVGPSAPSTST